MELEKKKEMLEQYEVLNQLGTGFTSIIKRGYDTDAKKEVALKILKDSLGHKTDKTI